jgi:hypothetical protein
MTEETRATCLKLLDKVFKQEYEEMFTPAPPWQSSPVSDPSDEIQIKHIRVSDRLGVTPQEMTMRKFCHYLFKDHQDEMLAIVQSNREPRRRVQSATHPFMYRRRHDEAAVDALNTLAQSKGITIKGDRSQQVDSYGEYRSEHLNYKSRPGKKNKMNIPGVVIDAPKPAPAKSIPTFVSDNDLDETVKKAVKLTELDKARQEALSKAVKIDAEVADDLIRQEEAHKKIRDIEKEQRELIRQLSGG